MECKNIKSMKDKIILMKSQMKEGELNLNQLIKKHNLSGDDFLVIEFRKKLKNFDKEIKSLDIAVKSYECKNIKFMKDKTILMESQMKDGELNLNQFIKKYNLFDNDIIVLEFRSILEDYKKELKFFDNAIKSFESKK